MFSQVSVYQQGEGVSTSHASWDGPHGRVPLLTTSDMGTSFPQDIKPRDLPPLPKTSNLGTYPPGRATDI